MRWTDAFRQEHLSILPLLGYMADQTGRRASVSRSNAGTRPAPSMSLPLVNEPARALVLAWLVLAAVPTQAQPQPARNRPGPWNNDVLIYHTGSEGRSEQLATFERAGVPTVARLGDGRLLAAFQHFPQDDERNFDRVAVSFSSDEGRTWSKPQPIQMEGLEAGLMRPFDPTLVPLPDRRVRLYFTSNRSRDFRNSTPAIYSAISSNGSHYVFEPGVRFALEGRIVIDCAAALHGGVFHLIVPDNGTANELMAGQARRSPPRGGTGYHAISRDGLKFERVADVTLPADNRWLGNLQSDGAQLVFFGTGPGPWPVVSADGVSWTPGEPSVRVPGADPGAVKLRDGSWLLLVTGSPRAGSTSAAPPRQGAAIPQQDRRQEFGEPPPNRPLADRAERGWPRVEGSLVRIPSTAAEPEGVAASLLVPRHPRFTNGAPVVIHVSGGVQAGSARGRPEYVGHGFVEIHFAFPGGGEGDERSGGSYDFRGPNCLRALADVIRFATGRAADRDGRFIGELARGVKVLTNNVGIVGSSHGGNACGMAMALHGEEFPNLAWYASMESPYGEGAANVELGGRESGLNPAYDPMSGVLDLSRLAWSRELSPDLLHKPMPAHPRELKGGFFFDLNGDGRFRTEEDFLVHCFVGDAGAGVKAWYSPRIIAEAEKRNLVPGAHPEHVPTLEEARGFWRYRDATHGVPDAVRKCPDLAVIVYANERDHVQADPAHTHILEQVEGFRNAGARFVRLNPDRVYVERVVPVEFAFRPEVQFPDNPAGRSWDRTNITHGLEPSVLPMGFYMQAAVCELADRAQAGSWAANLDRVLYDEVPGAPVRPLPGGGTGRRPDRLPGSFR